MLSVNILPRDERAVAFDCLSAEPSAQMEQGSPPFGGEIFKSRNSTSIMNFPVNGTSIAHTKSSLLLICLSVISIPFADLERIGLSVGTRSQILDPPLGKARRRFNTVSRIAHPSKSKSRCHFMDAVENTHKQYLSGLPQVCYSLSPSPS